MLFCGAALGAILALGSQWLNPDLHLAPAQQSKASATLHGLRALFGLPSDHLGQLDIAVANLLCAEGLPTNESVDVTKALALLDAWTKRVQSETQRHLYKFQKNPAEFNHSESYFRMLALITVLQ